MTYKDSVESLNLELEMAKISGGVEHLKVNPREALMVMSKIAVSIQSEHKPWIKRKDVSWTAGSSEYSLIADESAIQRIISIKPYANLKKPDYNGLIPVNSDQMNGLNKTGEATSYTLTGNEGENYTLEFDFIPDASYNSVNYPNNKFLITYHPRYRSFDLTAAANYAEWSDYDETAEGYGGSWKLPSDWHELIVEGAAAKILGDKVRMEQWKANCIEKSRDKETFIDLTLPSFLGVEEDFD